MSVSSAPIQRTVALQLAQALERYQLDFDAMVESWMETTHYRSVTRELHDIRMMKASLPQLSEEMAEVLIRHVELVHAIWNAQIRPTGDHSEEMKRLRTRHSTAVEAMRRKCVALSEDC